MPYALATIRHAGKPTPVIEVDGRYWSLAEVGPDRLGARSPRGLLDLFDDWAANEAILARVADDLAAGRVKANPITPAPVNDAFLTPLQFPAKVVLMGANYYEHVLVDAGFTGFDKANKVPTLFLKPPTTTLVGCGKTVRYPSQSTKFDWEIELAAIIGKKGRKIKLDQAMSYIAAYTIGLDLSARDWQFDPKHIVKWDLYGGKAFDDSCPLGPKLVPARFVDSGNLQLQLKLNGQMKQNANTRDMIWSLAEQIVAMSEHVTLEPGDVILTGTPSGVGLKTGTFMKVGDKIDAEITGLGRLSVEIIPDSTQ